MKAEFNSRVDLQREVIKILNKKDFKNQLNGLSKPAIDSWFVTNNFTDDLLKNCLITISEKLFFIANKSQDQVTEEYKDLQISVKNNIMDLKKLVSIE
jgi:Rps23 Pro-64 3,4-dihydroxylase Tpa1-like proline 4-hydroxylase